ncbi:Shedu immune nuclease family protein [Pannus brasiliensis]|uniref:Shedu immune nuclease family protein n=1 Tax=Pannus brasiliensis TaxID=1579216 RepID=UPI002FCDA18A
MSEAELKESSDILPFFRENLHLSAFLASYVPQIARIDRIKHEFTFFGDFRADLVVGDSDKKVYCFIEFEDATRTSIFINKKNRSTPAWSPRFEQGFSQIVDWFWKIDDFKNTVQFRSVFGSETIEVYGMLIIGRDSFLTDIDKSRLNWRLNKVVVDSRKIICITFDQLARDLRNRLSLYSLVLESNLE